MLEEFVYMSMALLLAIGKLHLFLMEDLSLSLFSLLVDLEKNGQD